MRKRKKEKSGTEKHGKFYAALLVCALALFAVPLTAYAAYQVSTRAPVSLIERGDRFAYILEGRRNAESGDGALRLLDLLPYNGDEGGTDFHGGCKVVMTVVDLRSLGYDTALVEDQYRIWVTEDERVRDLDQLAGILPEGESGDVEWTELKAEIWDGPSQQSEDPQAMEARTEYQDVYQYTLDKNLEDLKGIYFYAPEIADEETIFLYLTLSVTDENGEFMMDPEGNEQRYGDRYVNTVCRMDEDGTVMSRSESVVSVVNRTVDGTVWVDENENGIREEGEPVLSGVSVSLYRTTPSSFEEETSADASFFPAYNVMKEKTASVVTGEDGTYRFSGLEAGTYFVVFTDLADRELVLPGASEGESASSGAKGAWSEDGSSLLYAYLVTEEMPVLNGGEGLHECTKQDLILVRPAAVPEEEEKEPAPAPAPEGPAAPEDPEGPEDLEEPLEPEASEKGQDIASPAEQQKTAAWDVASRTMSEEMVLTPSESIQAVLAAQVPSGDPAHPVLAAVTAAVCLAVFAGICAFRKKGKAQDSQA